MGYGIWKANSKVITKLIVKQAAQEEAAVEEEGEAAGKRSREKE